MASLSLSRRIPPLALSLSEFREAPVTADPYAILSKDGKPITVVRVDAPTLRDFKRPEETQQYCRRLMETLLLEVYTYYYSNLWC